MGLCHIITGNSLHSAIRTMPIGVDLIIIYLFTNDFIKKYKQVYHNCSISLNIDPYFYYIWLFDLFLCLLVAFLLANISVHL